MSNDLKDYFLGADPKKHKDYNYFLGKGKKGWVGESTRHSMASYGIKTGRNPTVKERMRNPYLSKDSVVYRMPKNYPKVIYSNGVKGKLKSVSIDGQTGFYHFEDDGDLILPLKDTLMLKNKVSVMSMADAKEKYAQSMKDAYASFGDYLKKLKSSGWKVK